MGNTSTAKYLGLAAIFGGGSYFLYWLFTKGKKVPIELGDATALRFKWMNKGMISFAPDFRFDIRRRPDIIPFGIYTWQEGNWIETAEIAPEEVSEDITVFARPIPTDWGKGTDVDVKLVARVSDMLNETTVWQKDSAFTTV